MKTPNKIIDNYRARMQQLVIINYILKVVLYH